MSQTLEKNSVGLVSKLLLYLDAFKHVFPQRLRMGIGERFGLFNLLKYNKLSVLKQQYFILSVGTLDLNKS